MPKYWIVRSGAYGFQATPVNLDFLTAPTVPIAPAENLRNSRRILVLLLELDILPMFEKHHRQAGSLPKTLSLELLEFRVHVESQDGQFLYDLARCFDVLDDRFDILPRSRVHLRVIVTRSTPQTHSGSYFLRVESDPADALKVYQYLRPNKASTLASALNLWAVRNSCRYHVFHAGGLAQGDLGILLPGPSRSGKSTITAALLRRGYALLSDELCPIEVESRRLVSYRRAIWLRQTSFKLIGLDDSSFPSLDNSHRKTVGAADLGAKQAEGSPVPILIICPMFKHGAQTSMERLRPGLAVIALMESYCSQEQFKVAGLDLVIELACRLPCYRLIFSALEEAIEIIDNAFNEAKLREPVRTSKEDS